MHASRSEHPLPNDSVGISEMLRSGELPAASRSQDAKVAKRKEADALPAVEDTRGTWGEPW